MSSLYLFIKPDAWHGLMSEVKIESSLRMALFNRSNGLELEQVMQRRSKIPVVRRQMDLTRRLLVRCDNVHLTSASDFCVNCPLTH